MERRITGGGQPPGGGAFRDDLGGFHEAADGPAVLAGECSSAGNAQASDGGRLLVAGVPLASVGRVERVLFAVVNAGDEQDGRSD